MKLKEWFDKISEAPFPMGFVTESGEALHVIGTCKDCKYALGVPWPNDIRCERDDKFFGYDYGCIHFEAKG